MEIPYDIIIYITDFLPYFDVLSFSKVNKTLHKTIDKNRLSKVLLKQLITFETI
jgi:hypothetical protein